MAGTEAGATGGPLDPEGPDPAHIPDPMPEELQGQPDGWERAREGDPMEGEAPSG